MLGRLAGIFLICGALFIGWTLFAPNNGSNAAAKAWSWQVLNKLEKNKVFHVKLTPFCEALQKQALLDPTIDNYRGHVKHAVLLSQLPDEQIKSLIEKCLPELLVVNNRLEEGFDVEVDAFDTSEAVSNDEKNTRAWKTNMTVEELLKKNLILQFSFMDGPTGNKVGEAALTVGFEEIQKSIGSETADSEQKKTR